MLIKRCATGQRGFGRGCVGEITLSLLILGLVMFIYPSGYISTFTQVLLLYFPCAFPVYAVLYFHCPHILSILLLKPLHLL